MHPMRVLFKIPKALPPTLNEPHKWSADFSDFLEQCLQKDAEDRPTASELAAHPFVSKATSLVPIRNLLKLVKAEVQEEIEEISEEEQKKAQSDAMLSPVATGDRDSPTKRPTSSVAITVTTSETTVKAAIAEETPAVAAPEPAPTLTIDAKPDAVTSAEAEPAKNPPLELEADAQSSVPEPAPVSSFPTAFAPPPGSAGAEKPAKPAEAAASSGLGELQLDGSDEKKFKTLTKTRKYINEAGEEVTYTTKRVVETSHVAGKLSNDAARDWNEVEHKVLADFRRKQAREMKQLKREEKWVPTDLCVTCEGACVPASHIRF